MEADVVRKDKIAAAKKKVWFVLLLLPQRLVYFVAFTLMLCVTYCYRCGRALIEHFTFSK